MRLNIKYNNGKSFVIRATLISVVCRGGSNILRVYSYKPPVSVDSVKYTLNEMYGSTHGEDEEVLNMALADIGSFRMPTEFKTELMKNLSTEKTNLVSNSASGILRANEIKDLIDYVSEDNFNGDYTEELFEEFVENIIVNSRDELTFNLKCGLSLKEKVVR